MYIGDLYIRMAVGASVVYYSPTFVRGGLAGLFAFDVMGLMGTGTTLECDVEHKNSEDTNFTIAGTFSSMSALQVWTLSVSGLKEEIRLAVRVGGAAANNTVYANALAPQWRPY